MHKPNQPLTRIVDVRSSGLGGGSPRRLYHDGAEWVLEVVRHVNLGHDLVRPTTQRLAGQRAIAAYFKDNPDKALLAKATQRLIQGDHGDEPRTFNAEGGEWILSSIPPPARAGRGGRSPVPPSPSFEVELTALKAKVVALTALQEGLLTRLARLEAKLAGVRVAGADGPAPAARGGKHPSPRQEREEEVASSPGSEPAADELLDEELPADAGDAFDSGAPDASAAELDEADEGYGQAEEDYGEAEPAAADASEPPPRQLTLPSEDELAQRVALLIGGDVSVEAGDEFPVTSTNGDCYAAPLLDEHDRAVGVIMLDVRATVYLGGTLMMLSPAELDQQFQAMTPGEDSVAASAEICSALSTAISEAGGSPVRPGPLAIFDFDACSWAAEPAERRDLADSFGGRIAVLSRPLPEMTA